MHIDDAIQILIDYVRGRYPSRENRSSYGYEIYIPIAFLNYCHHVRPGGLRHGYVSDQPEAPELIPVFRDAAWELCRRGIFRPGLPGPADGQGNPDGDGFSVTAAGRAWLERADEVLFIPLEPSRFVQLIEPFRTMYGDGFFQRAQEAIRCHFATAYLACCVMCGAATESIMLRAAINKKGDEETVLKEYRRAGGRRHVENMIVGQVRGQLADQFRSQTDMLAYWRDESAHGGVSDINEWAASEALARLLRLAYFVRDHWDELVA